MTVTDDSGAIELSWVLYASAECICPIGMSGVVVATEDSCSVVGK